MTLTDLNRLFAELYAYDAKLNAIRPRRPAIATPVKGAWQMFRKIK